MAKTKEEAKQIFDPFSASCSLLTFNTQSSYYEVASQAHNEWPCCTGCSSKFWVDFKPKSWFLKKFYVSSSAGNPGSN